MQLRQMILVVIVICGLTTTSCAHKPVSVVLTYEIDGSGLSRVGDNLTKDVAEAINERLGPRGAATALDKKQIRIELFGKIDVTDLKLAEQRISGGGGGFELRILADTEHTDDLPIIKQAKLTPPDKHDVLIDDKRVAEWIRYNERDFGPVDREVGGMVKRQAAGVPEALVLIDDLNVTGEYLTSAKKGFDESNRPAIHFSLNKAGAERLKQLTSDNLPAPSTPDAFRKIGVIFDKKLVNAPVIRTTITDRGTISGGSLSEPEVDTIIDILNAGTLPCKIRLIEEKRVEEKK
jgi:preprotein translocase subunit SecD